jgi:two-component sensor histidine kinase
MYSRMKLHSKMKRNDAFALPVSRHLALLAALVLAPQIVLGGYLALRTADDLRAATESAAVALAGTLAQNIEREIATVSATLKGLASSSEIEQQDWTAFRHRAKAAFDGARSAGVAVRNIEGRLLFNSNALPDAPLPPSNPVLREFDKRVLAGTASEVVSDLHVGGVARRPLILVGVPARGPDGRVYSLSAGLDPQRFAQIVNDVALPDGWLASVIGRDRRVIARSRDLDRYLGATASAAFIEKVVGERGHIFSTSLDGVESLTAYTTLPAHGWTVITSAPRTIVDAPMVKVWWSHVGLAVIALLSSLTAALFFGQLIGGGLKGLAREALFIGAGESPAREPTRVAEIEAVHQSLLTAATELTRREEHQHVLMAELDHRVKNTLAIVQSLVSRTMNTASSPAEGIQRLQGRVMALARSHEVMSASGWENVSLDAVARAIVSDINVPVVVSGPGIVLRSRAVVAIAQSLHELATDADRRISAGDRARIELTWDADGSSMRMRWTEHGAGQDDFASFGFGRDVIKLCVERQLGGEAKFLSAPDGRLFEARIPFRCENLGENLALQPV